MLRIGLAALVTIPGLLLLSGCYGKKMLRQPVTIEETSQDVLALREQQAELARDLQEMEQRSQEQAELVRTLKAENDARWQELQGVLLAIDSKLQDALGRRSGGYSGSSGSSSTPYWSANPAPSTSSPTGVSPPGTTSNFGTETQTASPSDPTASGAPPPGTGTGGAVVAPDPSNPAGAASSAGQNAEMQAKQVYDQAYLDLTRGNYSLAILGFQEYLRRAPGAELADNAQYWIGDAYYAQRDFTQAIQEFQKVIDQYPRGDKLPAALLKTGFSYLQMDDRAAARRYLNQVVEKYPNAEEATLAKNKLRSIE